MRCEVLIEVTVKFAVLLHVIPYRLVHVRDISWEKAAFIFMVEEEKLIKTVLSIEIEKIYTRIKYSQRSEHFYSTCSFNQNLKGSLW